MVYTIEFTVADADDDEATTSVHVPESLTLAQYVEFAWRYAQTLDDWILGVFRGLAKLIVPVDISALTGNVASADSDVEQKAAFQFGTATGNTVDLNIPCLNELDILDFTDELDTADPSIAAVIAMMEDGLTITGSVVVQPTNIAEEDLTVTNYARAETFNSGKRR